MNKTGKGKIKRY